MDGKFRDFSLDNKLDHQHHLSMQSNPYLQQVIMCMCMVLFEILHFATGHLLPLAS